MVEVWRDIPGYVDMYQVSNEGRVKSLARVAPNHQKLPERILAASLNTAKYTRVCLCKNSVGKEWLIHRLVLLVFVGQSTLSTRHLNGIRNVNNLWNLKYRTAKENKADSIKHGTSSHSETHGTAKLTNKEVLEIKQLLRTSNYSQNDIAEMFGVSKATINQINTKRHWSHIKEN